MNRKDILPNGAGPEPIELTAPGFTGGLGPSGGRDGKLKPLSMGAEGAVGVTACEPE